MGVLSNGLNQLDANQVIRKVGRANSNDEVVLATLETSGLIPAEYDYIALTYVAAGNGAGEIETATYKENGAAGATVATLTLTYDASNRLSTVTRS